MDIILISPPSKIAITAAGLFFLIGLLTGLWKYLAMKSDANAEAPHYVSIAHRAALMYAFAAQLLATFAAVSAFPVAVNIVAVVAPLAFFAMAIVQYITLGLTTTSNNSIRDADDREKVFRIFSVLSVAEIGGFSVLLTGALARLWG